MQNTSQNKYYGLFNQIADPIFIFEKDKCKILDCNKSVNRIYGYGRSELKRMTFLDLHPVEELERVKKAIKIVNKDVPLTFTHSKKNGKRIVVEVLSDHIVYEGKDATVSIVRDVTDRVKIEKELERRASQATLISAIGKRISSNLDPESVLNEIVNSIHDAFDLYGVMLLLINKKKKQLNLQSIAGGYEGVFPGSLTIKIGEGMIGQAALDRSTQLSNDVTANPHYVKKAEEVTISELSIPIIGKDDVIGVLDFQSDRKYAFDKSDVEVAETLCSQIATAIENARLYENAQKEITYSKKLEVLAKRRATQSALLYKIGQKVSGELDLDNLLSTIVTNIRDSFDYYGVMLLSLDEETRTLQLQSISGAYANVFPVDLTIKEGEGMIGLAALTHQTQLSGDVTLNPNYVKKAGEITRSEMSIPIMKGEQVIGVLDYQSDQPGAFDESDVTAAETLSSQIAAAIDNARLYNQAQLEIEERLKAENELRQSRNHLQAAKKETDTILKNVEEGIFILDKDRRIGSQHSAALSGILDLNEPGQKKITEILQNKIDEKENENIQDYLELMFNLEIDEKTLGDLNPLAHIKLNFLKKDALLTTEKILAFKFQRIEVNQQVSGLMGTVTDITGKIKLSKKIEESKEHSKLQMEWFLGILHVEPQLLKEFIDGATRELNIMKKMFRMEDSEEDYLSVLRNIYRSIHLVKGNASLLDLKFFANQAHAFEELIEALQEKDEISSRDFIPLVMKLGDLRNSIEEINNMIERISQIHTQFRPKRAFENQILVNSIGNLISNLSDDLKKEVQFVHDQFKGEELPYKYRLLIKDLMIQFVRNSMTHGIEKPEARKKNNKSARGCIEISTFFKNGDFCFKYRDDGQGINLKKLREIAENSGKWKKDEIDEWDQNQLAELIYEAGISTAESVDLNAGRGVGMGTIKKNIQNHQGKISMNFREGEFLEFLVNLPVKKNRKPGKSYNLTN